MQLETYTSHSINSQMVRFCITDIQTYNASVSRFHDGVQEEGEGEGEEGREEEKENTDKQQFFVQLYGVDASGVNYSCTVSGFLPSFYIRIPDEWSTDTIHQFVMHVKKRVGYTYYASSWVREVRVLKQNLYGFENEQSHAFLQVWFRNERVSRRVQQSCWYNSNKQLVPFVFDNGITELFEAHLPPLLRFIHTRNIIPCGWVQVDDDVLEEIEDADCTSVYQGRDLACSVTDVVPLPDNETAVPLHILMFDIEAGSSHGDFPVPRKGYHKLARSLVDVYLKSDNNTPMDPWPLFQHAFFATTSLDPACSIDRVYIKPEYASSFHLDTAFHTWMNTNTDTTSTNTDVSTPITTLESYFERIHLQQEQEQEEQEDQDRTDVNAEEEGEGEEGKEEGEGEEEEEEVPVTVKKRKRVVSSSTASSSVPTIADVWRKTHLWTQDKELLVQAWTVSLDACFPPVQGDPCTMIGSTFMRYGSSQPYVCYCYVLNTCSPVTLDIPTHIVSFATEAEMLVAWTQLVQTMNPDIIGGYNVNTFDYHFLHIRSQETGCEEDFLKLGRNRDQVCGTWNEELQQYTIKEDRKTGSWSIDIRGRVQLDLLPFCRAKLHLTSYKLDTVASELIGDTLQDLTIEESDSILTTCCRTGNLTGLYTGSFVHIELVGNSTQVYCHPETQQSKFEVVRVNRDTKHFWLRGTLPACTLQSDTHSYVRWGVAKDDVTPKEMFLLTNGTAEDRAVVAKYCIQDCNLLHYIVNKMDLITECTQLANLCSIPMATVVSSGQGIKLTSLLAKRCMQQGILMPVLPKADTSIPYDGAIVLEPKEGVYKDIPVACNDFAGLYPSTMISENLSHNTKAKTWTYNTTGELIRTWQINEKYATLPHREYVDITVQTYVWVRKVSKSPNPVWIKQHTGHRVCRYVQPYVDHATGKTKGIGIVPVMLKELMQARKDTRAQLKLEVDPFRKRMLDARQNAIKYLTNSVYGQCGYFRSTFYDLDVAASTTSMGRKELLYAKRVAEECFANRVCSITTHPLYTQVRTHLEYIYGDTDSVFYTFHPQTLDGTPIVGKDALILTIELAHQLGELASQFLKAPHDWEYEKTFLPFIIMSKKRYVGLLYENNPHKYKCRKDMGIALKRLDYAPIVRYIFGGVIDRLLHSTSVADAMGFVRQQLERMVTGECAMHDLIITKSIRSGYKNPPAHKQLADRMTARDPGNKPVSGDRIPYVFVVHPNKKAKQGDRIETPSYVREHRLRIDYGHYITNQIMTCVNQVLGLALIDLWTSQHKWGKLRQHEQQLAALQSDKTKQAKLRSKEVQQVLFHEYICRANAREAAFMNTYLIPQVSPLSSSSLPSPIPKRTVTTTAATTSQKQKQTSMLLYLPTKPRSLYTKMN